MNERRISSNEWKRKAVHAGMGLFALALRYISWPVAALLALTALLFNVFVMPRYGRAIYRDAGKRRDAGIVAYPAVVLVVILLFRHNLAIAAAIWGMMALGDPAASIAGKLVSGPGLPWHSRKTWTGLIAYVLFGAAAGGVLLAFVGRLALGSALPAFAGFALLGGLLESIETGLDDNLTPGLGVAFGYATLNLDVLAGAELTLPGGPPVGLLPALGVNVGIAAVAAALRVVSLAGVVAAASAGLGVLHF